MRFTVTMTGGGQMAPIFCAVTGLSEQQLSVSGCPSGIMVVEVEGKKLLQHVVAFKQSIKISD